MKKICFVGMGNMASAMAKGFIELGHIVPKDIYAYALNQEKLKANAEKIGFVPYDNLDEMIAGSDIIIIAVTPQEVQNITGVIRKSSKEDVVVFSVASSIKVAAYEAQIGAEKKFARVMPNTLISSGKGYSAVCFNKAMDEEGKAAVTKLLSYLGEVLEIREDLFDSFTTFSCTGPFWIYKFMEAMIDAGIYLGFERDAARKMVVENLQGVGNVMAKTMKTPADMVDKMTSPGGNTIEGVKALYQNGMAAPIMESMAAVLTKCQSRG